MRRLAVVGLALAAACVLGVTSASATGTLDQSNNATVTGSSGFNGSNLEAQTFIAGLTGSLDTIQVGLCKIGSPGDLVVKIEGTYTDALSSPVIQVPDDANVLATQSVPASSVTKTCAVLGDQATVTAPFDSPTSIQAGTAYAIVIGTPTSSGSDGYSLALTGDSYRGG